MIEENNITAVKENILYIRKILQHLNTENLMYSNEEEMEQLDGLIFNILTKLNEEIEKMNSDIM